MGGQSFLTMGGQLFSLYKYTDSEKLQKSYTDFVPSCTVVTSYINKHLMHLAMLALMDSSSNFTLIHHSKLPPGCVPETMPNIQATETAASNFQFKH